jgi:hypothetical protein
MEIHPSIKKLAKPIDSLLPLEGNPRRGDIGAIAASYREFGQVKPIVVRDNEDGTFTVIAGNHQLEAAKQLGWKEIAAVVLEADDERAVAFALADNRTMELGYSEQSDIVGMLSQISDSYPDLLNDLRWDEFEMAAIEEWADKNVIEVDDVTGYVAPVMVNPPLSENVRVESNEDGEMVIKTNPTVDAKEVATRGSTAINSAGSQAIVQYTLVFDSPDQQKTWYDFIKFLRSSPVYEGTTTAERLIQFIEAHADY